MSSYNIISTAERPIVGSPVGRYVRAECRPAELFATRCLPKAVSVSEITKRGAEACDSEAFLQRADTDRFYCSSGLGGLERISVRRRGGEVLTEVLAYGDGCEFF